MPLVNEKAELDKIDYNFERIALILGQTKFMMKDAGCSADLISLVEAAGRNIGRLRGMVNENPKMRIR